MASTADNRPKGSFGPAAAALGGVNGVLGVILKPLMLVVGVFSTAKSFRRSPVIGSRILNTLGLHVFRAFLAHSIMNVRTWVFGWSVPAEDRKAYREAGIIVKPDFLDPETFARVRDEVFAYDARVREFIEGDAITRRALFDDGDAGKTPATLELEHHKPLARLMAMSSGGAPPVWSVECVIHGAGDPQTTLHSDTFHPSAKCWLYLEDVTEAEGPFVFTPGSHRLTWRRIKWEYKRSRIARGLEDGHSEHGSFRADPADIAEIGLPEPRPYPVKANTLVVANTYGFHRRSVAPPGAMRRAIYAFARSNPFLPVPIPPVGVAEGLLKRGRRRYFAWLDREVQAGRVAGRNVYDGRLDRP